MLRNSIRCPRCGSHSACYAGEAWGVYVWLSCSACRFAYKAERWVLGIPTAQSALAGVV